MDGTSNGASQIRYIKVAVVRDQKKEILKYSFFMALNYSFIKSHSQLVYLLYEFETQSPYCLY